MGLVLTLVVAAVGIGAMHTIAPDHWVPFAALARAERWTRSRTAAITALCGLGHVTVSVALGLASVAFGLEILSTIGRRLEAVAGFLLIAFGVVYALWAIHRNVSVRWHGHGHGHVHWHGHGHTTHEHHDPREHALTPWSLFLLFSADPCVAVIPLMFAAAPLGWAALAFVVAAYELATIGTMVALVLPAREATAAVHGVWADRYGNALAGAVIAIVGVVVVQLGW